MSQLLFNNRMMKIHYHLLNLVSVSIFSFTIALNVSLFARNFIGIHHDTLKKRTRTRKKTRVRSFSEYNSILESGFFKLPEDNNLDMNAASGSPPDTKIENLYLIGTIDGPNSISRALIRNSREREPKVFKMWNDVWGYKLVSIRNRKVILKFENSYEALKIYDKRKAPRGKHANSSGNRNQKLGNIKRTISRSELKQKARNNLDNMLRGLRAGPYRVNNRIQGYKIYRIKPYNLLYKYGLRNGDVIKRISGHVINGTQELYRLWNSLKDDSKITVNVLRGNRPMTFDLSITD